MLPATGSSSTLQAGTTEARNPDRSEFNRTSVPTVTVLDIETSTVRSKKKSHHWKSNIHSDQRIGRKSENINWYGKT